MEEMENGIGHLGIITSTGLHKQTLNGMGFSLNSSDTSAESALDAATSDEDDIDDWSYCRTCDQPFQSERTFAIHLRGVKHMQNALEKARLKHPERFLAETDRQNAATLDEPSQEEKHMSWLRSQFTSEKKRELGLSGSFVCELCRIECPSEKALSMHLSASDTSESSLSVSAGENAPGPPPCDHSSSQPW
ncbi:unnamed protein product [Protopolystoma xenopodis]|uniref:C2H2-type domain-containing protein n=1 Tax=Protopolystoma xenopodis TaxID=117903 RepID=A0A3S5AUU1_9PLAT|nr:unnamed protein product [Protopolystoma xenopodis]